MMKDLRPGLLALALGCSAPLLTQDAPATGPVLAQLQLRDQRLLIHGARGGEPRFTVTGRGGQVLAQGLSLDELRGQQPQLFQLYQRALVHRPVLDASFTPPREAPGELR